MEHTKTQIRYCAQCKQCGWDDPETGPAEAEYYVTGRVPSSYGDRMVPYRGYLCTDHLCAFEDDGAEFTSIRPTDSKGGAG